MRTIALMLSILLVSVASAQNAGSADSYLELDDYNWKVIESDHFTIYFDERAEAGARKVMRYAMANLKTIEDRVGYKLSDKIEIIYYNSLYDLNHSHHNNEQIFRDINTAGLTNLENNSFAIYRGVTEKELVIRIKRGIARVLVNDMIFEGSVQEKIKYRTLLHLPVWFVEGLSEYIAAGWDETADDRLRANLEMDVYRNMNLVSREDEVLAGRSIWMFIDERKGDLTIPRILYLVRLTRKVESAVYFVFNWSTRDLFREWESYYRSIYSVDQSRRLPLGEDNIDEQYLTGSISAVKLSPDGTKIAFCTYRNGVYQLVIHHRNLATVREGSGFTELLGLTDEEDQADQVWYQKRAFSSNGIYNPNKLIFDWKDNRSLYLISRTGSESRISEVDKNGVQLVDRLNGLENISDVNYNGSSALLIAASGKTGNAIYRYETGKKSLAVVLQDSVDYLEPVFAQDGKGFYFTRSAKLKKDTFGRSWNSDVGYYRFSDGRITWIADDPRYDESSPLRYGENAISFLSDENGIRNAYLFDGEKTVGLTDYKHNVLYQSNSHKVPLLTELLHFNGRYHIYVSEYVANTRELTSLIYAAPTYFASQRYKVANETPQDSLIDIKVDVTMKPVLRFQTDFPNDDIDSILAEHARSGQQTKMMDLHPYRLKWDPTKVIVQLHNGMLNTDRFAAYRQPQASFTNPFGIHGGVAIEDVHRKRVLTGGVKTNTSLYRMELYSRYENRKDRLVKSIGVWRKSSITSTADQFYFRNLSNDVSGALRYPIFSGFTVGAEAGFRRDKRVYLSSGYESLRTSSPEQRFARMVLTASFNQLKNRNFNAYEGLFLSLSTEYQVRINAGGDFGATHLEARYGKKLLPLFFWMSKLNANNSYGAGQMRYFMGGTENWINPDIASSPYLSDASTSYFVPVFGIRGVPYNIRNGNSAVTFNTEFRYEIGKRLVRRSGQSQFFENLMVLAFFDAGSAWYGSSPYDRKNPLNSRLIETGALRITVYNPQNPLVYGLGAGMRTTLLTYYLKWDVGFGRNNGEWLNRIHYISIGKDF